MKQTDWPPITSPIPPKHKELLVRTAKNRKVCLTVVIREAIEEWAENHPDDHWTNNSRQI